jgi:nucleoside-diphosphate-sugar epimerase
MKTLVLGSQGFISSLLMPELLSWKKELILGRYKKMEDVDDFVVSELIGVDNLMYNQCVHGAIVGDKRYSFIRQDVTDVEAMKELYAWADCIIPAACLTGAPICEQMKSRAWAVNYSSIKKMLDYLLSIGKKDTIIIGLVSNSGYGIKPEGTLTIEEDALNPISTYGRTKVALEKELMAYKAVTYRFATVFGPSLFHRVGLLVNTLVLKGLREKVLPIYEGHFQRNYLYIQDAIQAIKLGISKYDQMRGQVYNVGDTRANMTKLELAKLVAKYTGAEVIEVDNLKDPDRRSYLVSNAKIEAMGFKPTKTIEEVIQDLIKFYAAVDERSHNVYFGTT